MLEQSILWIIYAAFSWYHQRMLRIPEINDSFKITQLVAELTRSPWWESFPSTFLPYLFTQVIAVLSWMDVLTHPTPPPRPLSLSLSDIQMDVIPLDRFPVDSLSWSASVIHLSTALQMHKPDTWWRAPDFNYILFHSCSQFLLQLNNQVAPAMNTFCC